MKQMRSISTVLSLLAVVIALALLGGCDGKTGGGGHMSAAEKARLTSPPSNQGPSPEQQKQISEMMKKSGEDMKNHPAPVSAH